MAEAATQTAPSRPGGLAWVWKRQLPHYPNTNVRVGYLAVTVLATITLYYELYVGGSVSTLFLVNLHMSFTFLVLTLAFGNLIGAFGSLFAGLTDRLGRANLVVFGLLFTGIFVAFIIPAATNKWTFTIEGFVVGVVEGICLVATPALIRDFSPQVGRATAMGFWTLGPVLGSLTVSAIVTMSLPVYQTWQSQFYICGAICLVLFVLAFLFLRELAPALRDQLMVSERDRVLIELKAKGLDIEASLRNPWRQMLHLDIIASALGVSLLLFFYYTAVAFGVIYLATMFQFPVEEANALGNWSWGANAAALIVGGLLSDHFRVRKPFMLIGGIGSAVAMYLYLIQAGQHPGFTTLAIILCAQ